MSSLTPERWREVSPYLDEALALSNDERTAWFDSLERQKPELVNVIRKLLQEHRSLAAERFLESSPKPPSENSLAGQTIGAYTLLSSLGQGGMGSVWLAQRSDGRFDRRVAVKFLHFSVAAQGGIERFKREGRILAQLAHPHIAELLDAGITSAGGPYLVLEHVEGVPITDYCDQKKLDIDSRIRLFQDVLSAAAHAHASLIVHRDIKPSNVLVRNDGKAKLLDFGIAKLLSVDSTAAEPTLLTLEGGNALTPRFAAPEQVTGAPVTTATDVYALGVLLYLLLTGRHPAGDGSHSPAELVKAITETEPPRLSDVAASSNDGASLAETRSTTPEKLRRTLRGDLETIVSKALKKNPAERYASVTALADDLQRYLKHEPISARPDTFVYRAGKFLRRQWLPVTAATIFVAVLSASLYEVNRERIISQRRFTDVQQLASRLFDIDAQVRNLPGSSHSRQLIVNTALEYLDRLSPSVKGDPGLSLEVGYAYLRVARVQGVPIGTNLGQMDAADQSLQAAQRFIDSVLKAQPNNRTAMLRAAEIAHDRMILARYRDQNDAAITWATKASGWLEKFHAQEADKNEQTAIFTTYLNVAGQFRLARQYDKALELCERGSELARLFNKPANGGTFLWSKAAILQRQGDLASALKTAEESVTLLDPGSAWLTTMGQTTNFELALVRLGTILGEEDSISLGRSADAIQPLERAFDMADQFVHRDQADQNSRATFALAAVTLGDILRHSNPSHALAVYDHGLQHTAEVQRNDNLAGYEVQLLAGSSYALRELGRNPEAQRRLDKALDELKQLKLYPAQKVEPGSKLEQTLRARADYLAGTGNASDAAELYDQLLGLLQTSGPPDLEDAAHLSAIYASAAAVYRRAGELSKAADMQARRLEIWREWDRKLPNNAFVQRQLEAATNASEYPYL